MIKVLNTIKELFIKKEETVKCYDWKVEYYEKKKYEPVDMM